MPMWRSNYWTAFTILFTFCAISQSNFPAGLLSLDYFMSLYISPPQPIKSHASYASFLAHFVIYTQSPTHASSPEISYIYILSSLFLFHLPFLDQMPSKMLFRAIFPSPHYRKRKQWIHTAFIAAVVTISRRQIFLKCDIYNQSRHACHYYTLLRRQISHRTGWIT